jgi:hypothetical protein
VIYYNTHNIFWSIVFPWYSLSQILPEEPFRQPSSGHFRAWRTGEPWDFTRKIDGYPAWLWLTVRHGKAMALIEIDGNYRTEKWVLIFHSYVNVSWLTGAFYVGNGWVAGGCWDDYWWNGSFPKIPESLAPVSWCWWLSDMINMWYYEIPGLHLYDMLFKV